MEEASVAGESPDRSKQRASSAEPTSGSAGPVPEARSESRDVRDPRLALTGESAAPEARGGVDTATRVLSVRDVTTATEEAEKSERAAHSDEADEADEAEETGAEEAAEGSESSEEAESSESAEDAEEAEEDAAEAAEDAEDAEAGAAERAESADAAGDTGEDADDASDEEPEAEKATEDTPTADQPAERGSTDEPAEPGSTDEPADRASTDEPAEPGSTDGGKAADGEEAPQGPPAADNESRTGGAGGNKPAEGEAEAEPADAPQGSAPQGPVDQPTTMLKLGPTAKLPQGPVDQPTTMLKLGGTAKKSPPESEAERTSKFVALKPLDDPETRKPKPANANATAPADATTPVPQVGPERTTQQPLPPKPPLDLLAELTNTPPPPQTPLRTLARRVKIWTPLVVLLVIVFAIVQSVRPLPAPVLALTAKDTYAFPGTGANLPWPSEGQGWMDVNGIGTMDHFGRQTPVAIGSVAKTMTAYIILRDHPLKPGQDGPKIKVDATAEKEGGYDKSDDESTLNTVKAGDFLTEKQALSAVMIPSANNIARLLARWDMGSEAAFVKKMNATAKELGMTHTTYTDPSGLKETTISTAEDQVKLGNQVVRIPALVAITSAASWKDPSGHTWPNWNALPYRMGAIGIKTGSTTAAGGNLLFAARKTLGGETVTVVGAILGQHKPAIIDTVNAVSQTALTAAQNALASQRILKKGDVVGYVDDQLGGHTPIVVTKDVSAVGWAGMKVKLSFAADRVPHSAKAGTKVGTLTVGDGSGGVEVPVALQKDLTEPGFAAKLTRIA
jgi:D-alanyl-D-alanine carboxypeptidase